MSIQRVPTTQAGRMMNLNIQKSYSRLVELQDQLSSGKLLQRPSDGPAEVMVAMDHRGKLRRAEQYERNTSDAVLTALHGAGVAVPSWGVDAGYTTNPIAELLV